MKVHAFPIPVEGETVQSTVARFLRRNAGHKGAKLAMLGLSDKQSLALIPGNLADFTSRMPAGHPWHENPRAVANEHSAIPLHLYFAHPEYVEVAMMKLVSKECRNPVALLGLTRAAAERSRQGPKHCADCVQQDIQRWGFPVSYAEHQPSIVKVCARHGSILRLPCLQCAGIRGAGSSWQMAGECECGSPGSQIPSSAVLDKVELAGLRWIARQVHLMLSSKCRVPQAGRLQALRNALLARGFAKNGGIDPISVVAALNERFGPSIVDAVCGHRHGRVIHARWPARLLGTHFHAPESMRALLLTGLVAEDVTDLDNGVATSNRPSKQPKGYGRRVRFDENAPTRQEMLGLLQSHDNRIGSVARVLGMDAARVATRLRELRISIPLTAQAKARLSPMVLEGVRLALQQGIPKNSVLAKFGISAWTMTLIELADLQLAEAHQAATIEGQRCKHRDALSIYVERHPAAGRHEVAVEVAGAVNWLRKFDRDWLSQNLPAALRRPVPRDRAPVIDWQARDMYFASAVDVAAEKILNSPDRPQRVTRIRLLRLVAPPGAVNRQARRYPITLAAAERHTEPRLQFEQRKLKWAVAECAKLGKQLSCTQLLRVAALPSSRVRLHCRYIVEQAAALNLPIHGGSFLSPLQGKH